CDCGENGLCKLVDGVKTCICKDGFEFDGYLCSACDCGSNGKCSFEGEEKRCDCANGYSVKDGLCESIFSLDNLYILSSENSRKIQLVCILHWNAVIGRLLFDSDDAILCYRESKTEGVSRS
ncbi:hypothetical protein AVEN_72434-1, partial [Araneus ventricosus]